MQPLTAYAMAFDVAKTIEDREIKQLILRSLHVHSNPDTMVRAFHKLYGLPIGRTLVGQSVSRRELRLKLILEEFLETVKASGFQITAKNMVNFGPGSFDLEHIEGSQQDIVEIADGLADIVYVCFGMAIEYGIDLMAVLREVHAANLTKLGEDGKPIINGVTYGYRERGPQMEDGFSRDPDDDFDPTLPVGKVLKGPNYMKAQVARILNINNGGMNEPRI